MSYGNNLLDALLPADIALIAPALAERELERGHVLCDAGEPVRQCWFPVDNASAAFVVETECGNAVETAVIGREGALGGIVSDGRIPAFARAAVIDPGRFLCIASCELEAARHKSPAIRALFSRYADCLLAQVFQAAACNASHTIAQRTARWLVAAVERSGRTQVEMTQEQFAGLLGVGRSYASRIIRQLRIDGLVETRRGKMVVRDLEGLRAMACGCNAIVLDHFQTVMPGIYPVKAVKNARR